MDKQVILKEYKINKRFSRKHQKEMEYAQGYVYNHKNFLDGEYIYTTAIVKREGNKIETTSGSMYILD